MKIVIIILVIRGPLSQARSLEPRASTQPPQMCRPSNAAYSHRGEGGRQEEARRGRGETEAERMEGVEGVEGAEKVQGREGTYILKQSFDMDRRTVHAGQGRVFASGGGAATVRY